MVDTVMLLIAQIYKAIIAALVIRMNNTVTGFYTTPNNGLQCGFSTIGDDFGVDFTTPFKDAEYRCLAVCATTPFAFNSFTTKISFIHFNLTLKGRLLFTKLDNKVFLPRI